LSGACSSSSPLVSYERRQDIPLIHMPTFARRQVLTTNLTTLLAGFGLFGSSLLSAQFVQEPVSSGFGFGATATEAGLFLLPGAAVMLVVSAYAGRLSERIGARGTLLTGAAAATAGLTLLAFAHGLRLEIYAWNALVYLGVGLVLAATPMLIMGAVPRSRTGESTAANTTVRYVGSALGAQSPPASSPARPSTTVGRPPPMGTPSLSSSARSGPRPRFCAPWRSPITATDPRGAQSRRLRKH